MNNGRIQSDFNSKYAEIKASLIPLETYNTDNIYFLKYFTYNILY